MSLLKKQNSILTVTRLLVVAKLFSDGGEVHGLFNDLPVSRDDFLVDWREEGPRVPLALQLVQQHSGENK